MRAATVAAVLAVFSAPLAAQESVRPEVPQIVVSASGEVRLPPDRASIMIGVQSRAATAAAAAAENSRKQRAVIEAVRQRGVPAEQIGTHGFNVVPETRYDREGQQAPRTISYLVTNVVSVEVRRIDQVGPVIDAALAAGANQINSLSFGLSQRDSAHRAALASAVARARADADAMARAAGGRLGRLLELRSSQAYFPPPRPMMADMRMAATAESVPIEPGQEAIRAEVVARWAFVQGTEP